MKKNKTRYNERKQAAKIDIPSWAKCNWDYLFSPVPEAVWLVLAVLNASLVIAAQDASKMF